MGQRDGVDDVARGRSDPPGSPLLWVGTACPRDALRARGLHVSETSLDLAVARASAVAPELVVVACPPSSARRAALDRLSASVSTVPIAVVDDEDEACDPPGRFGTVARWSTKLDPEALADRVERLIAHLDQSSSDTACDDTSRATTWIRELTERRKAGFLVRSDGPAGALGPGGLSVAPELAEGSAIPALRLVELPAERLRLTSHLPRVQRVPLAGARVLVIDSTNRARSVANALKDAGAEVRALDAGDTSLDDACAFTPSVVVISVEALRVGLPPSIWCNARFIDASFVVVTARDCDQVVAAAARALGAERVVRESLLADDVVVARLERFGVGRWLKMLAGIGRDLVTHVSSARGGIAVELASHKIRGATWTTPDGRVVRGREAVDVLLSLRRGRCVAGSAPLARDIERQVVPSTSPPAASPSTSPPAASPSTSPPAASPPAVERKPVTLAPPRPVSVPRPTKTDPPRRQPSRPPVGSALLRTVTPLRPRPSSIAPAPPSAPPVVPTTIAPSERPRAPRSVPPPLPPRRRSDPPPLRTKAIDVSARPAVAARESKSVSSRPPPPPPRALARRRGRPLAALVAALEALHDTRWRALTGGSVGLIVLSIAVSAWSWAESPTIAPPTARASAGRLEPSQVAGSGPPPRDAPSAPPLGAPSAPQRAAPDTSAGAVANIDALARDVEDACAQRQFERCEGLARQVLAHAPDHDDVRYHLALSLFRRRIDDEALVEAERGIASSPRPGRFYALSGDIHARHGRVGRATGAWQRCLESQQRYDACRERLASRTRPVASGDDAPSAIEVADVVRRQEEGDR